MQSFSTQKVRVLIIGAGAIGALYGYVLASQGWDVSVVCRSDFEAVKEHGYRIDSIHYGQQVFRPSQVLRDVSHFQGGAPDFAILCAKVTRDLDRVALLAPAVGPNTNIVLIENGIDIEEEIQLAFPNNPLLSVLALVQASRTGAGEVKHSAFGELMMGVYPSGINDPCRLLSDAWQLGGIRCKLTETVVTARWQKCVWNAAFNVISIVAGGVETGAIVATERGRELARSAMNEVMEVARAAGHELPEVLVDQYMQTTANMPSYKTSMTLDYLKGRPMEIEAILGNVVRSAQVTGTSIPVLTTLYALATMVELAQGNSDKLGVA